MSLPKKIHIQEVCPREGWQNFKCFIPTETKIELIKKMVDYGAKDIELGIFSSTPKLSWQFTDLEAVCAAILEYADGRDIVFSGQIDGVEAAKRSRAAGIENVNFFVSASEAFSQAIAGKPIEYSLVELEKVMAMGMNVTVGFGAALGCPFGELITDERVMGLIERISALGVKEFSLADSGGITAPDNVRRKLSIIREKYNIDNVGVHLHQTRGMGLANAFAAMEEGVSRFDVSLGAMGGCPFIPGAKGNIATEDMLNMVMSMGMETDLDYDMVVEASLEQSRLIDTPIISSMASIRHSQK